MANANGRSRFFWGCQRAFAASVSRIPEEAETALDRQLRSSDYTIPRKVLGSGRWALVEGLQVAGESGYGGFGKSRPRLLSVPGEEFGQGHVVYPFGYRRRNAVQNQGLHPPPFRRLVYYS